MTTIYEKQEAIINKKAELQKEKEFMEGNSIQEEKATMEQAKIITAIVAKVNKEFDLRINEIDNNQKQLMKKIESKAFFNERIEKIRLVAYLLMIGECGFFIIRFMIG